MDGLFIVIEGADGTGTTTQAKMLRDWIEDDTKKAAYLECEPTDSEIGKLIRRILKKELHALYCAPMVLATLFTADRLYHCFSIGEALSRGECIVCDRYLHSTLVYQGLLTDSTAFTYASQLQAPVVYPNVTYILDLPVDEAQARLQQRQGEVELFDHRSVQERVLMKYREMSAFCPEAELIDGRGTPEQVQERIVRHLKSLPIYASYKNIY